MAACENTDLVSHHRGVQGSAGSTASFGVGAHTVDAGKERATLLSPRHIEKAAEEKKKKPDHSSTEVTQPLRGTAVYLCRV